MFLGVLSLLLLVLASAVMYQRSEHRSELVEEVLKAVLQLLDIWGFRDDDDDRGVPIDADRLRTLHRLAAFTIDLCESMQIKCWLHAGTLLGAWRAQRTDPWDHDVDFGILKTDEHKFREQISKGAIAAFIRSRPQYSDISVEPHTDFSIPFHIQQHGSPLWATIFSYETAESAGSLWSAPECHIVHEWSYASSNCRGCRSRILNDNRRLFEVPCDWVLPGIKCKINGIWAWCPQKSKQYLHYYYGDLAVPDKWRIAEAKMLNESSS